jgi:hypothetical protein
MTAKRVIEQEGKENVILLFTDTLIEDEDLYRFMDETVKEMGVELVKIADGRTPFEVYKDVRFLGNSRLAPCSHELKQKPAEKWIKERFKEEKSMFIKKKQVKPKKELIFWEDPEKIAELKERWESDEREACRLYLGIDWTEEHRTISPIFNWAPYQVEFPMCKKPYLSKEDMLQELERLGIGTPRLYKMGFSHNNCGGFCCRAGQGHFANLLEQMPERFAEYEAKEEEMRQYLDSDVAMMKKTKNGITKPYTLKQLREDYQKEPKQIDMFDVGGCGCFVQDEE